MEMLWANGIGMKLRVQMVLTVAVLASFGEDDNDMVLPRTRTQISLGEIILRYWNMW